MKLKDFMKEIDSFENSEKSELLKEAIKSGMFDDKKTSVMLDSDKSEMKKTIAEQKKIISEYQITLNAISPLEDYIPLYTALSDKNITNQHGKVKEAFDLIDKAGFKVCDWEEVRRLSQQS